MDRSIKLKTTTKIGDKSFLQKISPLDFASECQVAGITEARYDVRLGRKFIIDCCRPNGDIRGEISFYILDAKRACQSADDMSMSWSTPFEKRLVGHNDGGASGQHGIAKYELAVM